MNNTDWSTFRCRCSGIAKILPNAKGDAPITEIQLAELKTLQDKESLTVKQGERKAELLVKKNNIGKISLGQTAIAYLMEVYAWETQGMIPFGKEVWEIDQLQKGKIVEEESITLISVHDGLLYFKNDERICNDYLSGEPDIFTGDNIMNAERIIDAKTCFDYPGFLQKTQEELNPVYGWQVKGYCDITGALIGEVAYCLVDMPETMINDYKRKLFYKMDVPTEENIDFKKKWEIMERSMRFKQIPIPQRVHKQKVEPFTPSEQKLVYDKVKYCREWLWKFDEMYKQLNIIPEMSDAHA